MRLRELNYPIAVVQPRVGMMGGTRCGFGKPSRYDWNLASYYIDGHYDDAIFYDSNGRRFVVETIEFRKPQWWRYVLHRLGYFVVLPDPDWEPMVNVDMTLRQTGHLTLEELTAELTQILLDNPSWWKGIFSQHVISTFFQGDTCIPDAFNHIGIIDGNKAPRAREKSTKIVNLM